MKPNDQAERAAELDALVAPWKSLVQAVQDVGNVFEQHHATS